MPRTDVKSGDTSPEIIPEADLAPVAKGQSRIILVWRERPDLLVKVANPARRQKTIAFFGAASLRRYRYLAREETAYREAMIRAERIGRPPPIAPLRGLVLTGRGLGQVVEKVRGADGGLAPTLSALARAGRIDPAAVEALNRFLADLRIFGIVAHDLRAKNLVYETWAGRQRFVLVDGFGDKTLIPLRRWLPWLDAPRLDARCAAIARETRLGWDSRACQFALPKSAAGP